jgi:hypothetical protein
VLDVLFCLGFVAVFVLILGVNLWNYWRVYGSVPTYEKYRTSHPGLLKFGRCHCRCCGSGRIYVHSLTPLHRRHICANCGTVLYRS